MGVQAWLLAAWGTKVADEDQTLLWYAAKEFAALNVHQLTFFGQTFGTVFEALPAAILTKLGVGPDVGVPVSTTLLVTVAWASLAFAAWRSGHRLAALAALAAPLLLSTEYLVLADLPRGFAAGGCLAAVGVGFLITGRTAPLLAAGVALGCLGVAFDTSSAILVVPALVFVAWSHRQEPRVLALSAVALLPAAAWVLGMRMFFTAHPGYGLAGGIDLSLSWGRLIDNVTHHLARYLELFVPQWHRLRTMWLPLGVMAVLCASLWATRRLGYILASATFLVLLLLALASSKSLSGNSLVYLSFSRLLLPLPMVLWLLLFFVADSGAVRTGRALQLAGIAGLVAVVVASTLLRAIEMKPTLDAIYAQSVPTSGPTGVVLGWNSDLTVRCGRAVAAALRARSDLVVYAQDQLSDYGCGALEYGRIQTIFPDVDRRAWRLAEEAHQPRTAMVVSDIGADWCQRVHALVETCNITLGEPRLAAVTFRRQPILSILLAGGVPITLLWHFAYSN